MLKEGLGVRGEDPGDGRGAPPPPEEDDAAGIKVEEADAVEPVHELNPNSILNMSLPTAAPLFPLPSLGSETGLMAANACCCCWSPREGFELLSPAMPTSVDELETASASAAVPPSGVNVLERLCWSLTLLLLLGVFWALFFLRRPKSFLCLFTKNLKNKTDVISVVL